MKKGIFSLAAVLLLLIVSSCGGRSDTPVKTTADFEIKKSSADTVCMLFAGKDGPSCNVSYSLHYAEGADAQFINDILTHSMFPESTDSMSMEQAALAEMRSIVADYKKTLRGVTRKSITEGFFPLKMAQYRRQVTTEAEKLKDRLLVYTAMVQEKAYGETDSLVCRFSYNISLNDRRTVTPDDIFVQGHKDRLAQKIVEKLSKKYNVSGLEGLQRKGFFADGIPYATDNIVISSDAITFVYNPFEIAGRSYGIIEVSVPAGEVRDIMEKKWITFFETK